MIQYNTLNVKLSNCDSNDENNFLHKLQLTNTHNSKLCKALHMVHQLIQNYQKFSYMKWENQEDF